MPDSLSILECDNASIQIDGCTLVIDDECCWRTLSWASRSFHEHGMHILSVEHVIHMTPPLFIICQVIDIGLVSGLPVTINELSQDHRVSLLVVHAPFMQPSSPVRGTAD